MEPAEAEVETALQRIAHDTFLQGELEIVSILTKCLDHRLHPDFGMDRVIRATFTEIVAELREQAPKLAEKVYPCPPSPSTNPTTT